MSNWADEETDEPLIADHRNFYKVEKWSRDGQRVVELLFAGSSLDKAKRVFDRWAMHPRCMAEPFARRNQDSCLADPQRSCTPICRSSLFHEIRRTRPVAFEGS